MGKKLCEETEFLIATIVVFVVQNNKDVLETLDYDSS